MDKNTGCEVRGRQPTQVALSSQLPLVGASACWETLGFSVEHMPQSYPIQEVRELGYLYTNSHQLLIEDCFQEAQILWNFCPASRAGKTGLMARESAQPREFRCWQLEVGPVQTEMIRTRGYGWGNDSICCTVLKTSCVQGSHLTVREVDFVCLHRADSLLEETNK